MDLGRTFSDIGLYIEFPRQNDFFFFGLQVEVLTSLKALSHHVDPSQLPTALEGPFPYRHGEWVQFFQVSIITAFTPRPHPFSFPILYPVPWIHLSLSGSKTVIQQTLIMRVERGVKKSSGSGARRPGSHPQLCCVTLGKSYAFSEPFSSMTEWGLRRLPPPGASVRLELRWV